MHNYAQTARNLRRSLRIAAVGARLIQTEGLDSNRLPCLRLPSHTHPRVSSPTLIRVRT
jgi:hypothetical protein